MSCKTPLIFVSVFLLISRITHNSNRNTRFIRINRDKGAILSAKSLEGLAKNIEYELRYPLLLHYYRVGSNGLSIVEGKIQSPGPSAAKKVAF